jgi:hypothetical protein
MDHFELHELVCDHVFKKYKNRAWMFLDPRLITTINNIRERIGKPITINNWKDGGTFNERGLRCTQCSIVKDNIAKGNLYMSAHVLGKGVDFDIQGMTAEESRQYIINHATLWPYHIRLEAGVNWVHLDLYNQEEDKVILFNP